MKDIRQGHVYFMEVPEDEGLDRRVIVVARDDFCRGNAVLAVPVTSTRFQTQRLAVNAVPFDVGEAGFDRACCAKCENIFLVSVRDLRLDAGPVGRVSDEKMRDIIRAVGHVLDADCEPR